MPVELKIEHVPDHVAEGGRVAVVPYHVVVNLGIPCHDSE